MRLGWRYAVFLRQGCLFGEGFALWIYNSRTGTYVPRVLTSVHSFKNLKIIIHYYSALCDPTGMPMNEPLLPDFFSLTLMRKSKIRLCILNGWGAKPSTSADDVSANGALHVYALYYGVLGGQSNEETHYHILWFPPWDQSKYDVQSKYKSYSGSEAMFSYGSEIKKVFSGSKKLVVPASSDWSIKSDANAFSVVPFIWLKL